MNEDYKIIIESTGDYKTRKAFNKVAALSERQYLDLVKVVLNFLETPPLP